MVPEGLEGLVILVFPLFASSEQRGGERGISARRGGLSKEKSSHKVWAPTDLVETTRVLRTSIPRRWFMRTCIRDFSLIPSSSFC